MCIQRGPIGAAEPLHPLRVESGVEQASHSSPLCQAAQSRTFRVLAVSCLSAKLYSSSKTSVTPLNPGHKGPGKWALCRFHALKTIPDQKARFRTGSLALRAVRVHSAPAVCAFSSKLERQRTKGREGAGSSGPFKCLSFSLGLSIFKEEKRWREGTKWCETQQTLLRCAFFSCALKRKKVDGTP